MSFETDKLLSELLRSDRDTDTRLLRLKEACKEEGIDCRPRLLRPDRITDPRMTNCRDYVY